MIPIIEESERATSDEELDALEQKYNFVFPPQYRAFLLRYNGGMPEPYNFTFGEGAYTDSMVDRFLAVYEGENDNFEDYYRCYKVDDGARIPLEMVPIAHDPGGNLINIAVSGPQVGAVFFWDHEREMDDEKENNFLIAKSFDEFLEGLTGDEEE